MALARRSAAPGSQFFERRCIQRGAVPHCPMASLQDIFRQHFAAYAAGRTLHSREARAAFCIANCFGPALGTHVLRCPLGHFQQVQPRRAVGRILPEASRQGARSGTAVVRKLRHSRARSPSPRPP